MGYEVCGFKLNFSKKKKGETNLGYQLKMESQDGLVRKGEDISVRRGYQSDQNRPSLKYFMFCT